MIFGNHPRAFLLIMVLFSENLIDFRLLIFPFDRHPNFDCKCDIVGIDII